MRVNFICCVYKITSPSKKVYIGSSIDFAERISTYKSLDCKQQPKLYNSFKKYGFKKHKIEILERCEEYECRQKEAYYGQLFNCLDKHAGLNLTLPKHGEGFNRTSEETRRRIGLSKVGNRNNLGRIFTEEHRLNISKAKAGVSRAPQSEAAKAKMSESVRGDKNHKAIILLNIQTGIYYECFMDAANSIGMNYNTFRSRLYHKRPMPFIVA